MDEKLDNQTAQNSSENQNSSEQKISNETDDEPYFVIKHRNSLWICVVTYLIGLFFVITLKNTFFSIAEAKPILEVIKNLLGFLFFAYIIYSILFLDYIECYNDKIIIKKYLFDKIVIYEKDIIQKIPFTGGGAIFIGEICTIVSKRKIGIRISIIPCLTYKQCSMI